MMFKQARKLGAAVLTAALLVTAGILPSKQAVSAAASVSQSYSTALSETTLTGVFGANDFYFTVDRHWNVQSVNLHLDLSQSQRIDPDGLSELTVSLNGQPVYSAPLRDYLADHSQMDISLDTKKLAAGSNDVKVQVYRRLSDQPCADDVSSANWVRINSGSAVQVQYADQAPALKLSEYPYPFYRLQQAPALPTAVTVGEKADAQELAGALEIASAFGRYAGSNDVTLQTVPLQSLSSPQDDNIIYFGKSGGAPAAIKALFPSGTDFSSGAWMRVAPSPYDAGHVVLAVLADKDTDLERASQFLQNDSLVAQADTDLFHLDSSVNVLTKDTAQGSSYTFSSLGYGGSYLYGVFRKTATMDLKLPQNRELDDSSTVTLHFRYSQNLDFTRSLVTLYVNNVPIGSEKLTSAHANDDSVTLTIPKEARSGSYLSLKIAFDLDLPDQWCTKREEEMPWAYIVGDSSLYLPTTQVPLNLFENLSSPFVTDHVWNHTAFVLPDTLQANDLNLAGQIAVLLGRDVRSNHGSLQVSLGGQSAGSFSSANLIVLGTPQRQLLLRTQNKNLFFQYDNAFSYFLSNEKMELLPLKSKTLASFQLLDSPYNSKNAMLVLTAPNEDNLTRAVQTLFTSSSINKLTGDGSLVETQGTLHNFHFKKAANVIPQFWNGSLGDSSVRFFLLMAAGIVVLILAALLLRRRRARKLYVRLLENKVKKHDEDQPK